MRQVSVSCVAYEAGSEIDRRLNRRRDLHMVCSFGRGNDGLRWRTELL